MIVAQRITITVPDELHERLQRVKSKINVSKICQEAIEEEVGYQEVITPLRGLQRLRVEKRHYEEEMIKASEDGWYETGYEDAASAAEDNITYEIYLYLRDCYADDILPDLQMFSDWMHHGAPSRDDVEEEEGGWFHDQEAPICYYEGGFQHGLRKYWEYARAQLEGDKEGTAEENDSTDNS